MQKKQKAITCLIIKHEQINWIELTDQTKLMRNRTNEKIRMLGNKYYLVNNLFLRLGLKKSKLFTVGRELEVIFKDTKKIDHLQTQLSRMKESIIAWYAEFFYNEIIELNTVFYQHLLGNENIDKFNQLKNLQSNIQLGQDKNLISNIPSTTLKDIENTNAANVPEKNYLSPPVDNDMRFNKEIDNFDNVFSSNDPNGNMDEEENENFNFKKYLNF